LRKRTSELCEHARAGIKSLECIGMARVELSDEVKIGLLKDEYLLLQKFYEDFDTRIMTIKGWSATIGLAALGAGFYQTKYLWLFASGSSLIFWVLDATWKSFQYSYRARIVTIEAGFSTLELDSIAPLQIYSSWFDSWKKTGPQIAKRMGMGIVLFPHIVPVIFGVALFFLEVGLHVDFHRPH
jgi:hypothetical protein